MCVAYVRLVVFVLVGAPAIAALAVGVGVVVFSWGTSGERFHAALAATDLQPGARGDATLVKTSSGWRIELTATGLPALPGALLRGLAAY